MDVDVDDDDDNNDESREEKEPHTHVSTVSARLYVLHSYNRWMNDDENDHHHYRHHLLQLDRMLCETPLLFFAFFSIIFSRYREIARKWLIA